MTKAELLDRPSVQRAIREVRIRVSSYSTAPNALGFGGITWGLLYQDRVITKDDTPIVALTALICFN